MCAKSCIPTYYTMNKLDFLNQYQFPYDQQISKIQKHIVPNIPLNSSTPLYLSIIQVRDQINKKLKVPKPALLIDKFLKDSLNINFDEYYPPETPRQLKSFISKYEEVLYKPNEKITLDCILYYISKDFEIPDELRFSEFSNINRSLICFMNTIYYFDRFQIRHGLEILESCDRKLILNKSIVNQIIQILYLKNHAAEDTALDLEVTENSSIQDIKVFLRLKSNLPFSLNIIQFSMSINMSVNSITNQQSLKYYLLSLTDFEPTLSLKFLQNYHYPDHQCDLLYIVIKRILEKNIVETSILKSLILSKRKKLLLLYSLPIMCLINYCENLPFFKMISGVLTQIISCENNDYKSLAESVLTVRKFNTKKFDHIQNITFLVKNTDVCSSGYGTKFLACSD